MAGIYDEQILGARQQAETSRKLRESISAPEGQMVSGHYVAPSITQYMAEALKSYYAGQKEKTARNEYEGLSKKKQEETARLLKQLEPTANVSLSPEVMNNLDNQQGMADAFAQGATQTSYTQPTEQQRMAALLQGASVNPEAFAPRIQAEQLQIARDERANTLKSQQDFQRELAMMKANGQGDAQRGQIIFDNKGNAFNVNPYTNEVRPVATNGKQIQGAQWSPDLQGRINESKAAGNETGKAGGEAVAKLSEIESQMPQLEKLVASLSEIGKKATYTKAGQIADTARREMGLDVGEGAIARKEYISKVDNEVLPLLRQTFGAAFTEKEGAALRATLGDPNASPAEKDMVLKSFIETKKAEVGSLKRRVGATDDGWSDL